MNRRILELDALRGLAIIIMIILDAPPDQIYPILQHARWQGLTIADLAFPLFVFSMGASAAISKSRKIFRRAGILFLIGIVFNILAAQSIDSLRIFGILQRLALTYLFGMLILRKIKSKTGILAAAFLLLVISSLGFHIYNSANPFDEENNISRAVDYLIPGVNHIYTATHDPEGLYGTIASTASMLIGYLTGKNLGKVRLMILFGFGFLILGGLWSSFDIIAKKLWTAPFVLINAGIDLILLAALTRCAKRFQPLIAFGKNPLFFFLASNFCLLILYLLEVEGVPCWIWIYQKTLQGFISVEFSTTIFCIMWCVMWMIPAEILSRRGIIIKI